MAHVADVVTHALLRSATHKVVWHLDAAVLAVVVLVAVIYLARRYP